MSVEEMNALRAKIGLKPLDPTLASTGASSAADDDSTLSTMERLRLAKERRMERERARTRGLDDDSKPKLFSLGDASDEEESAASWVEKHKKVSEEKKKAAEKAKQLEEAEEDQLQASINVEGIKVAHDIDQLGEDTILVIKDTHVLNDEDGDELENSELVSVEKGKKYQEKMKKKSKYDVYDEDGKIGRAHV